MRTEIRGVHVEVGDEVRRHVDRRLSFALGRFERRIGRVLVRLEDVNGPRGGADKRCRISVALVARRSVVVEETGTDLFAAIDGAADRAGRAVARRVSRIRDVAPRVT